MTEPLCISLEVELDGRGQGTGWRTKARAGGDTERHALVCVCEHTGSLVRVVDGAWTALVYGRECECCQIRTKLVLMNSVAYEEILRYMGHHMSRFPS